MVRLNKFRLMQVKETSLSYDLPSKSISTPQEVRNAVQAVMDMESKTMEHFGFISLNTKNQMVGFHEVSVGSLNASIVHPREVFKMAVVANAASIILFHNHPSGDPTASPQDIEMTERLKQAGDIMGIEVIDHIITGLDGRFISMREHGLINSFLF